MALAERAKLTDKDILNRKETTELLRNLIAAKTSKPGVYGAHEVALDWGTAHPKYVDYMTFSPENTVDVSGIEKGIFTCYEIKSCYEDLYSGKGLNFIGEKNYLVTTMDVYKRILDDEDKLRNHIQACNSESRYRIGHDVGVYVLVPEGRKAEDEFSDPSPLLKDVKWELVSVMPCHATTRKRSLIELLFCMMKARTH